MYKGIGESIPDSCYQQDMGGLMDPSFFDAVCALPSEVSAAQATLTLESVSQGEERSFQLVW